MTDTSFSAPLPRRAALARLAGAALSVAGLSAFRFDARRGPAGPAWDERFELAVDLEIAAPNGARWHRPYVAVWVENAAGERVRTISLWVNNAGRGRRYIRELRRWWIGERDAEAVGAPDAVESMSSATRLPGRYTVTWNGRDDRGRVVEQGAYRVFIEASREHGSYRLMEQEVRVGAQPVTTELTGNEEIRSARIEYRRRK